MPAPDGAEAPTQVEDELYEQRFPETEAQRRMALWQVIASHLQRYVPETSTLIELGAGDGEFISNIVARERWATDTVSDRQRWTRRSGSSAVMACRSSKRSRPALSTVCS